MLQLIHHLFPFFIGFPETSHQTVGDLDNGQKNQGEPNDEFWAMYEEYEQKRMQLGKYRMAALHNYTMTYKEMTEKETDHFMKKVISKKHLIFQNYQQLIHLLLTMKSTMPHKG